MPNRTFSFQSNFGISAFSFLLAIDTFILILFGFAGQNFAAQFATIIVSAILIPVYFLIVKSLQKFIHSAKWDYYLLYPFVVLSALLAVYVWSILF